jgi:nicotinate-nucleotide adenylyltransferase
MGKPGLVPSLLEAGPDLQGRRRYYSIETVRRVRRVAGAQAELYFLVGADSFLYLEEWKNFRALIRSCDFVVASRPGFDWGDARVNFARTWGKPGEKGTGTKIRLPNGAMHFLPSVREDVSSSEIRHWARCGRSLQGSVPGAVADYIEKLGLYRKKR